MRASTDRRASSVIGCGGCSVTWTGLSRCHCAADTCHVTLSGVSLFEQHRRGGRCTPPDQMTVAGEPLRLVDGVWRGPQMSDDEVAARTGGAR